MAMLANYDTQLVGTDYFLDEAAPARSTSTATNMSGSSTSRETS
jgi:hypothetical protein